MIIQSVRDILPEDAVIFNEPSFDRSIVGTSDNGGIVYNYDSMVREFAQENQCSEIEAMEFIDFNTLRTIDYCYTYGVPPIILYTLQE